MASFFDEIAKNRIKSAILMLLFGAVFVVIIYFFVLFMGGGVLGFALGIGLVAAYAIFTYFMGSKMVLAMSGAKEADKKEYRTLYSTIEGLSAAMQIPMPKVYIINDPNPNAFATGRNRKMSAIAVTTGLLAMMDKTELEGVIAHEASHIADNDIQFMLVAVVFGGAIGLIAAYLRMTFFFGFGFQRGGRGNSGMLMLAALLVGIIAPLVAMLVRLAISRKREYMADANGARVIRNPAALASALKKIGAYSANPKAQPAMHANEVTSSMYFSNPLKPGGISNLFSTHPPIAERIKILEGMY